MPPMVIIPQYQAPKQGSSDLIQPRIHASDIKSIVCHRNFGDEEEYLVEWSGNWLPDKTPFSWHSLHELALALHLVQDYTSRLSEDDKVVSSSGSFQTIKYNPHEIQPSSTTTTTEKKRRHISVEAQDVFHMRAIERRVRQKRTPEPSATPLDLSPDHSVYNGILVRTGGFITIRQSLGSQVTQVDSRDIPTSSMLAAARGISCKNLEALHWIRREFIRRLNEISGPTKVSFHNSRDKTTPSLAFTFTDNSILREGVQRADPATLLGCTKCKPHMGQGIGCEYTKLCDCLADAAVDKGRLSSEDRERLANDPYMDTTGLPKRFPYSKEGMLVSFYLEQRYAIFECNSKCNCGPSCKNRLVQHGRTVPLQIFKTKDRGFGLRSTVDIKKGQFIDVYRGEIITDAEADRREKRAGRGKDSYFYSLDKFQSDNGLNNEDIYVVDGEFFGGPARFINHSCNPNVRQFTVSYNKYDPRVYELAFFAREEIQAYTELTFDYMDKDMNDNAEDVRRNERDGAVQCNCGEENCRKWLWI